MRPLKKFLFCLATRAALPARPAGQQPSLATRHSPISQNPTCAHYTVCDILRNARREAPQRTAHQPHWTVHSCIGAHSANKTSKVVSCQTPQQHKWRLWQWVTSSTTLVNSNSSFVGSLMEQELIKTNPCHNPPFMDFRLARFTKAFAHHTANSTWANLLAL